MQGLFQSSLGSAHEVKQATRKERQLRHPRLRTLSVARRGALGLRFDAPLMYVQDVRSQEHREPALMMTERQRKSRVEYKANISRCHNGTLASAGANV